MKCCRCEKILKNEHEEYKIHINGCILIVCYNCGIATWSFLHKKKEKICNCLGIGKYQPAYLDGEYELCKYCNFLKK